MSTGNLRVFMVFLVVQVCLLAMLVAPWTVRGRIATVLPMVTCCNRVPECCFAAGSGLSACDVGSAMDSAWKACNCDVSTWLLPPLPRMLPCYRHHCHGHQARSMTGQQAMFSSGFL
uniref:Uncharacterized protein n=1 Tax=Leersia perrieri TaxID=77586 RepID=A0A0D9V6S4_9ORYZ